VYDQPAADYSWPTCTSCGRDLRDDELGRVACFICQDRADHNLASLAGDKGLYAGLRYALMPGVGQKEGRISGSRTAPLPLRLEPLSLSARGGVVTILQTWQVDWHEALGWTHPRWRGNLQQQLDDTVQALRNNLNWAASSHPAFPDFAAEAASITRDCRRQATGEQPERRIALACPCGGTIRVTISTPGARCHTCSTQYGRTEVLELPLAARKIAA
jgi:hypothetical protein